MAMKMHIENRHSFRWPTHRNVVEIQVLFAACSCPEDLFRTEDAVKSARHSGRVNRGSSALEA